MSNIAACHSHKTDRWSTPRDLYDDLYHEFGGFDLDAAATADNALCNLWLGPGSTLGEDALRASWRVGNRPGPDVVWLNPPYSRCAEFIAKAAREAHAGHCTVVCLLPARTDTRYFHQFIWDRDRHTPRPGVEVRFLKGRLRFSDAGVPSRSGAPFPSLLVIFRANEVRP